MTEFRLDDSDDDDDTFSQVDRMMSLPEPPKVEPEFDQPDASLLDLPKAKPNARKYETKANKVIGALTRVAIQRPATVPDAAAMLQYGPKVARSFGNLAADNDAIKKLLDVAETATENSTAAAVSSVSMLLMQLARNHEPVLTPKPRTFVIPILKRTFKLPKIGIRLGLFRAATHDPDSLTQHVLTNPAVIAALAKNGITLVDNPS